MSNSEVSACPFCALPNGDDIDHWDSCVVLKDCLVHMFGEAVRERLFGFSPFHLQLQMTATDLQHLCACIHAIWRCRNVIVHVKTIFFTFGYDGAHEVHH